MTSPLHSPRCPPLYPPLYLESVGVLGPGMPDWPAARRLLRGESPYEAAPELQPDPRLLPPNERRRVPKLVRWAIAAAHEAMEGSERRAEEVTMVFTSSSGDGEITHRLCEAVASPARRVSPTLFHNSVHNAPTGYWSIGTGSQQRSVSVCGYDASFAVGLLEAASLVIVEQVPVLLVACDVPYPDPLSALRPVEASFAVALLLSPKPGARALGQWTVALARGAQATRLPSGLPQSLATNPGAHSLALLEPVARGRSQSVPISYVGSQHVAVEVSAAVEVIP